MQSLAKAVHKQAEGKNFHPAYNKGIVQGQQQPFLQSHDCVQKRVAEVSLPHTLAIKGA